MFLLRFVFDIIVLGLMIYVLFILLGKLKYSVPQASSLNYYQSCVILTPAERAFWLVLQHCIPPDYVIFTKVRLADIIKVRKGFDARLRQRLFNRISCKHADFVICHAEALFPLVIIELDDASHQRRSAVARDIQKDVYAKDAGIQLIRIRAQHAYNTTELKKTLCEALHLPDVSVAPIPAFSPPVESDNFLSDESPVVLCPDCGSAMVLRTARKGINVGSEFWGCSRYPQCLGVLPKA